MIYLIIYFIAIGFLLRIVWLLPKASWYDLRQSMERKKYLAHPNKRQFRPRPEVLIILFNNDDLENALLSLASLQKIRYRKYNVQVVGTKLSYKPSLVNNKKFHFVKNITRAMKGRGQLVLKLESGTILKPDAINRAVWHLNNSPDADAVAFARQPVFYPTLTHLFATFHLFITSLALKSYTQDAQTAPQTPILWRRRALSHKNSRKIIYADDALIIAPRIKSFSTLWKLQYRKIQRKPISKLLTVALFIASTYVIYAAIYMDQSMYLIIFLAGFTLTITGAIWWNNHINLLQKYSYLALIPVSFGYFYILLVAKTLKTFADMTKAIVPVGVSLFARVKNVSRVV